MSRNNSEKRRTNILYVLPNLITICNISLGFFAILLALKEVFWKSGILIMISMLLDGIDGRIARMTGTSSRFGLELDSLSDLVSFGVAPSVLIYCFILKDYGRIGGLVSWLFVLCGALRLARFNVQSETIQREKFLGLPIPAAASFLASFVCLYEDLQRIPSREPLMSKDLVNLMFPLISPMAHYLPIMMVISSYLMISNLRYKNLKNVDFINIKPFRLLGITILLLFLILIFPSLFVFLATSAYIVSGPIGCLLEMRNVGKIRVPAHPKENKGRIDIN